MVARGAGAAGPVLLACRHWDPLGLARRLPSLGVGAWRCAPLLPWRVQCPVCVCAALAAGSGGSGRYLEVCLSRFPLPAPRVPRCVWRAVPSGCPLPSLAGTPFHAVCAFRALGPVALLVVPACPFRVCALALSLRPLPPLLGGVACAPRVVPALGAGRAVPRGPYPSACPAPVPCSVWRAFWGGRSGPGSPLLGLGLWGWRQGVPGGGAFYRCQGRLGSCAPPPPTARPRGGLSGSAIHVLWARACGCGGPALGQAPSLSRLPAHWAGCWGPPPTCCGRGCVGVGAQHRPRGLHALRGLHAAGVVGGRPRGGWPATVVRGAWSQALSLPRLPVLWSGQPGFRVPCVPGAVRGDPTPAPERAPLRAGVARCGVAEGRPRGRCLPPLPGASGVRRCPSPDCPPIGRAVGVRHPRAVGAGVWVWGPNTVPLACMLCGGCVPRGWWGAVPGGGGLPPLCGAPGVRRYPSSGRPSSGAGSQGSATRVSRMRSVRAWGPSTGPTACALAGRRCSLWGWRKGVPGEVPSTVVGGA